MSKIDATWAQRRERVPVHEYRYLEQGLMEVEVGKDLTKMFFSNISKFRCYIIIYVMVMFPLMEMFVLQNVQLHLFVWINFYQI